MGISIRVFGKTEFISKYRKIAAMLPSMVTDEMKTQMMQLADYVRTNKLSGDPLHRRTGKLSRSISGNASATGNLVTGTVGSKGVPYAAVHELGLTVTIPSHERLISMVFGKPVVPHTISIKSYTVTFPMRAYLKPSLEEKRAGILANIRASIIGAMRNAA
jgi:phage gpG-like protein